MSDHIEPVTVSRIIMHILQSITVAILLGVGHYVMALKDGADQQARDIVKLSTTVQDLQGVLNQYDLPQLSSDVAVLKSETLLCQANQANCRRIQ